ncbi:MAG TPA: efflux RND transporter periplasmic adaptor subunit [Polyangiaceae bacterium]|nr:efflux RND transporter periplasmic adaptor subunit [Polyangiaceae bacterium]
MNNTTPAVPAAATTASASHGSTIGASASAAATEELQRTLAAEEGGRLWLRRAIIAGVFVIAIAAGLIWRAKHRPPPPAKYMTAAAAVGDVFERVQATGAVQPVLQVNVGAQANGRVTDVFVDFNSNVKKGDVLAVIDPTVYGTQVTQGQANLVSQRAQLASAHANMVAAKLAFDRTERLYRQNLATAATLDSARGVYEAAQATENATRASIGSFQAQLHASETNVSYTKIISPVDGVVVTRSIDPGATVQSSFQTPVLFVIAQDLRKMRVLADVDEADVGHLKEKMEADAVVDAFPGESFHGIVQQVRYSPNNQSGVVTYSAVVEVDNPEEKLRPGMTATVTVRTREAKSVLRVPNAALRYRPSPPLGPDNKPIPQPPDPPLAKGKGRVYVLTSDKPGEEKADAKIIDIGASDGIQTEITNGSLPADAKVVTDELDHAKKKGPF